LEAVQKEIVVSKPKLNIAGKKWPLQLAECQRIRQQTMRRVDAEALSHAQGTPEHEKELQQTGPVHAHPASRRMSLT
jgi:hypothetical protein